MELEETDWSVVISWIGTIIGFILNITPAVQFWNIFKGKEKIDIVPESMLIFNICCSELWACYWIRQDVFVPCFSAVIGLGLSQIFAIIYLYYFTNKQTVKFLIYIIIESGIIYGFYYLLVFIIPSYQIVGTLAMLVNIFTYIAPGQKILIVIKERNYRLIPIASTIAGMACSASWLTFGLMIWDKNTIVPNSIGLIFSIVNTSIWTYYYLNRKDENKGKVNLEEELTQKI